MLDTIHIKICKFPAYMSLRPNWLRFWTWLSYGYICIAAGV